MVMKEIIDLDDDGFQKISDLLAAPGEGSDTTVLFALNSPARFISNFGKESQTLHVEENLLKLLENK